MSIKSIEISGYKSISHVKVNNRQITALIGQNGSGKSNILSAIQYFYRNLTSVWEDEGIFDANNFFSNEIRIRVEYDLKNVLRIVNHNQNNGYENYESYYRKIQAIFRNNTVVVELIKRKGRKPYWNAEYNVRQIVAALFPIYFVDARKIDLTDWNEIWELVGDLVKLRYEDMENVQNNIAELVRKQDVNISDKLARLEAALKKNLINVERMTAREMGKSLSKIIFNGQVFQYDNRRLNEFSNGTNAYNYSVFLMDILSLVKTYKLKEPIIVLDEPEISLHIEMIDRLMDAVFNSVGQIQFILSTHSARCIKNLIECTEVDYDIYHVALKGSYTYLKKIRNLAENEERERIIATDTYMNSCFARMTLHVEGATELEVFKNRHLRDAFPVLKSVEIMTGMSDRVVYNLTAPIKRNYQTPSMAVVDMDQRLEWKKELKGRYRFCLKKLKEYPVERENYHYGKKRKDMLYRKNRIKSIGAKCNFTYYLPFFSCEDFNFKNMLELTHNYYMEYNMFTWNTTIEGALITKQNLSLFWKFMKEELETKDFEKIEIVKEEYHFTGNNLLNYIRLIFSGKSDFLMNKRQICNANPGIYNEVKEKLGIVRKTSGWVSRWLAFYFKDLVEKGAGGVREHVRNDFEELYQLFIEIEKQMTERK